MVHKNEEDSCRYGLLGAIIAQDALIPLYLGRQEHRTQDDWALDQCWQEHAERNEGGEVTMPTEEWYMKKDEGWFMKTGGMSFWV